MGDRTSGVVAGLVAGLGLVLTGVHLVHALDEFSTGPDAVLYGVVFPLVVALGVVGAGYWIVQRPWGEVTPWRLGGWCWAGVIVGVGLAALLIQYQAAEGVQLSEPLCLLAIFATYGGAMGLLLGRYDFQHQERHARQVEETERLEEFASLVSNDLRNR
jgi:hypothetical protein